MVLTCTSLTLPLWPSSHKSVSSISKATASSVKQQGGVQFYFLFEAMAWQAKPIAGKAQAKMYLLPLCTFIAKVSSHCLVDQQQWTELEIWVNIWQKNTNESNCKLKQLWQTNGIEENWIFFLCAIFFKKKTHRILSMRSLKNKTNFQPCPAKWQACDCSANNNHHLVLSNMIKQML